MKTFFNKIRNNKKQNNMENNNTTPMENNNTPVDSNKTKIYNLVILDKSGSMNSIAKAAIDGFNETLGGIRSAQRQYAETQEHYVSLLPFCNCEMGYVYDRVPVAEVKDLTSKKYRPCCGTPLFDAMGKGINDLYKQTKEMDNATVIVTIITDGEENASREYSGKAIKALVDKMRDEQGWNFAYIGTNQDVDAVAEKLSILNTMFFEDTDDGMRAAWERERRSRGRMFGVMHDCMCCAEPSASREERNETLREMLRNNKNYREIGEFSHRVTPYKIDQLRPGQVFVFGSNAMGAHQDGAAYTAVKKFGAVMGQGEGMQGDSYAIVTMDGLPEMREQVMRFIQYAKEHPERTFLVTRIGCGIAGYSIEQVAPLFISAIDVENIWLPQDFWQEII